MKGSLGGKEGKRGKVTGWRASISWFVPIKNATGADGSQKPRTQCRSPRKVAAPNHVSCLVLHLGVCGSWKLESGAGVV